MFLGDRAIFPINGSYTAVSVKEISPMRVATQIRTEQTYTEASLMFSYKDKKKAIDLYYNYGRKITAVTGELTYPDKHTFVQLDQRV